MTSSLEEGEEYISSQIVVGSDVTTQKAHKKSRNPTKETKRKNAKTIFEQQYPIWVSGGSTWTAKSSMIRSLLKERPTLSLPASSFDNRQHRQHRGHQQFQHHHHCYHHYLPRRQNFLIHHWNEQYIYAPYQVFHAMMNFTLITFPL